jgi:hypothetical protein
MIIREYIGTSYDDGQALRRACAKTISVSRSLLTALAQFETRVNATIKTSVETIFKPDIPTYARRQIILRDGSDQKTLTRLDRDDALGIISCAPLCLVSTTRKYFDNSSNGDYDDALKRCNIRVG